MFTINVYNLDIYTVSNVERYSIIKHTWNYYIGKLDQLSMYCLYMRLQKYSLKKPKYFEIRPNPKSQYLFVYDLL